MGNSNGFNGFGLGGGSSLKPVRIRSQGYRTQLSQRVPLSSPYPGKWTLESLVT